jgi:hypothetical protein
MSNEKRDTPEQRPDEPIREPGDSERVARFAKYTSPIMLAMLVSSANKAFAS